MMLMSFLLTGTIQISVLPWTNTQTLIFLPKGLTFLPLRGNILWSWPQARKDAHNHTGNRNIMRARNSFMESLDPGHWHHCAAPTQLVGPQIICTLPQGHAHSKHVTAVKEEVVFWQQVPPTQQRTNDHKPAVSWEYAMLVLLLKHEDLELTSYFAELLNQESLHVASDSMGPREGISPYSSNSGWKIHSCAWYV